MHYLNLWIVGSVLASLPTGSFAQDASFCDRLNKVMADTRSDHARAENLMQGFGPSPAACAFSKDLSGSKSANCNWAFSYRSDAATKAFAEILTALSACADPDFGVATDQHVNHPDFYDLRLVRIVGGEVGLSLKDKATLQQTYVFLRFTPAD